ncbi:MAG: right-handed parallel beta-helix repeat-containing protein, partial [Planctomycetes bacterium]|nr:right-handed parallel beta-helix repeat-containing protein [Planctomycetota bacterium]
MTNRWVYLTVLAASLAAPVAAHGGGVLHVDDDAPPAGDGASWETPYRFLQDALATAGKGGVGEIRVAQGVYRPDRDEANPDGSGDRDATFQLISGVALMGGYAGLGEPDPDERDIELYVTVLSGDLLGNDEPDFANYEENSYSVLTGSDTNSATVLDGVTVTAGNSSLMVPPWDDLFDPNPRRLGGGMFNQSGHPTLLECIFIANKAVMGAGIFNWGSSSTIIDCTFLANSVGGTGKGGGIRNAYHSHVTITNCAFVGNDGGSGGAIADRFFTDSTVSNCVFVGNVAEGGGGAMVVVDSGAPSITDCLFADNIAGGGAGLFIGESTAVIDDCEFVGNSTGLIGAGIALVSSDVTLTNCNIYNNISDWIGGGVADATGATFVNCAISGNWADIGGGLYVFGNSALFNCTIGVNNGNGIDFTESSDSPSATLANSILWGNSPQQVFGPGDVTATYSDIQGGWPGIGNIDADPLFVQPAGDNLRLAFG